MARILETAIGGSDRDKSDAGRAIVDVAAVYLDASGYERVIAQLAASRYKHFKETAEVFPARDQAKSDMADQRLEELEGRPIGDWSVEVRAWPDLSEQLDLRVVQRFHVSP